MSDSEDSVGAASDAHSGAGSDRESGAESEVSMKELGSLSKHCSFCFSVHPIKRPQGHFILPNNHIIKA